MQDQAFASPRPKAERSPSLSPLPATADDQDGQGNGTKDERSSTPNGHGRNGAVKAERDADDDVQMVEDQDEQIRIKRGKQLDEAKKRHQADLVKHAYEPPKADRPQDDWQVAYVWAFIVKFNQREKIRKLECLEDFETALVEPIANQPDDILEGVLVRFMNNLKPGNRNINSSNVQKLLSQYIDEHLSTSPEFTVWDRPWAPNEEVRSGCCTSAPNRQELGRLRYPGEPDSERLGRNPMKKIMEQGGGVFELDWRERVKILRQLVDWQLTDCEQIRAIINSQNGLGTKGVKVPDSVDKVAIEPLGMDRDKNRIWALDNSGRLYKSSNPFKRPCPLHALSSNKTEFSERIQDWKAHGASTPPSAKASSSGGKKLSKQEQQAMAKAAKGIKMERELAERAEEMIEAVDKEEQRILRARKRAAETVRFAQQAEFRSTRTRRPAKKVDYTYNGFDDDDIPPRRSARGNGAYEPAQTSGRAVIPGERKSARQAAKEAREAEEAEADADYDDGNGRGNGHDSGSDDGSDSENEPGNGHNPNGGASGDGSGAEDDGDDDEGNGQIDLDEDDSGRAKKRKNGKGWQWVEESVDVQDMTVEERERYERVLEKRAAEKRERKAAEAVQAEEPEVQQHDGTDGKRAEDAIEID